GVDTVGQRASVELAGELEEVLAALLVRVVVPEDRLVLVRPASVDPPEGRVVRNAVAEVRGDALRNDHPTGQQPTDLPGDERRGDRAEPTLCAGPRRQVLGAGDDLDRAAHEVRQHFGPVLAEGGGGALVVRAWRGTRRAGSDLSSHRWGERSGRARCRRGARLRKGALGAVRSRAQSRRGTLGCSAVRGDLADSCW